jgi:antitoxin PrlF
MKLAESRLTRQGQISVPAEVRRRLGLQPGSMLQWDIEDDDTIVVRRVGGHDSEDVHRRLFPVAPPPRGLDELKAGIKRYIKATRARG